MNRAARKLEKPSRAQRRRSQAAPTNVRWPADRVWFFVIFGCAFFLRLIYLFQIESIPLFYYLAGDGRAYDEWAQRIAAGDWLGTEIFYQAPLYPYFLGVLQFVLGHNLWQIRLLQITLGALSCAVIFLVGRSLFSRQAGMVAGLMLACYAPAIFFDGLIEKSILDLSLLCLLLLLLSRSIELQLWTRWLAIGAVAGLLGLSRENALVLVFVVPLWIALYFSGESTSTRLRWAGLFLAGVLVVLNPVGLRNLAVGDEFTVTTSQFGPNFFIGNNPSADGTYGSVRKLIGEPQLEGNDAKRLAERAAGRSLTPGEVSDYWFRQSWTYITLQPWHWLKLLTKKWLLVWNGREIEDSDDFYIYQQWSWLLRLLGWINHFGVLAPLAAVGLWFTRNRWRQLWLFYAITLSLALSVAIFYVFGRYRFPLVPLLALFAGVGLVQSVSLYKQRARAALLSGAAVFAAASVIVNWPMYSVSGPGAAGYNNLANAYYKQGKVDEAIATARKAIQLRPDYGVAHFNLGNFYAGQGKLDLAQHHFEKAIRIYPNYASARSNLGQLLVERGNLTVGIQHFRRAIELNPTLSEPHFNLGLALVKQDQIDEAVSPFQEAVRLAPDSAEAHYGLGSVYAALNRYEEAAKYFSEAVRIRRGFAEAHQSLAQIFSLQGKKELAIHHYQEATRLMRLQGATTDSR